MFEFHYTAEEYPSLVECFPTLALSGGSWEDIQLFYRTACLNLKSKEYSEIGEYMADQSKFARTMRWYERMVIPMIDKTEPSPNTTIATPEAAIEWMVSVSSYLIYLAFYEAHMTYMIILDVAPACSDGQRCVSYAHELSGMTRDFQLYRKALQNFVVNLILSPIVDVMGDPGWALVHFWEELIPLSEKIAIVGDEIHALHEMAQAVKDVKSPADLPDGLNTRMVEIYNKIDCLPRR